MATSPNLILHEYGYGKALRKSLHLLFTPNFSGRFVENYKVNLNEN